MATKEFMAGSSVPLSRFSASLPTLKRENSQLTNTPRRNPRKGPKSLLRTGGEGGGVLDGLEGCSLRVDVVLCDERLGIDNRHQNVDVGQSARESPVVPVERATRHDLGDDLNVVWTEKPEVARVTRQRHGLP